MFSEEYPSSYALTEVLYYLTDFPEFPAEGVDHPNHTRAMQVLWYYIIEIGSNRLLRDLAGNSDNSDK